MGRWRYRARLEDGLKLDLNRLFRDGFAKRGEVRRAVISWHRGSFRDIVAAAIIEAEFLAVESGAIFGGIQCISSVLG
jgi:hypothetical protein